MNAATHFLSNYRTTDLNNIPVTLNNKLFNDIFKVDRAALDDQVADRKRREMKEEQCSESFGKFSINKARLSLLYHQFKQSAIVNLSLQTRLQINEKYSLEIQFSEGMPSMQITNCRLAV